MGCGGRSAHLTFFRNELVNQENGAVTPNRYSGDAARAALLSAVVVPGAGQIYNKQWLKGIVLAVLFLVSSLSVLVPITIAILGYYINIGNGNAEEAQRSLQLILNSWIHFVILTIVSTVIYVFSIVDAYRVRKIVCSQVSEKSIEN